jgi:hypothetical protein
MAALWLASAPASGAESSLEAGAEAAWDANVTRAQLPEDIRRDSYVAAHAGAALRWPLGDYDAWSAAATVRGANYVRYPRLSYAALDASVSYRRKLGVGLQAPWLAASAAASHEDFREDLRDSDRIELRLETGMRASAAIDLSGGYAFDRRYARHDDVLVPGISGAVWDLKGHTGFVRAGWAIDPDWQLDLGVSVRRGDVVATTHRNLPIFLASAAIAESQAFGPDFYDYRLRGTTQSANATVSYALGERASLNLTYAYAITRATLGLEYRDHVASASWLYRY